MVNEYLQWIAVLGSNYFFGGGNAGFVFVERMCLVLD